MEVTMAKKKSNNTGGISDFAGFDAKPLDHLWKVYPKAKPSESALVFAHTFFDARKLALLYFKDEKGFNLGYSEVTAEVVDEGQAAVAEGTFFLAPGTPIGVDVFEATRATDREGARRGHGIRKRKPVALERGREVAALPNGVQANGQALVLPQTAGAEEAPHAGAQGGEGSSVSGGAGEGTLGGPPVGPPPGSTSGGEQ